jgi:hypothetical protein
MATTFLTHVCGMGRGRCGGMVALLALASSLIFLGSEGWAQDKDKEQPAKVSREGPLPFSHKVEVYRNEEGSEMAFVLRLEQPFLAEEFEKSNYLRLQPLDSNAYLIYPSQTKFQQKHAEFHGRLRGKGKAQLRITYETVSENLDGSRRITVRHGDVEVPIPVREGGAREVFRSWAEQQNRHFLNVLSYYPRDTFAQFVLLQSRGRYGVTPPPLPRPVPTAEDLESRLYHVFTGGYALQETLQRRTLTQGEAAGDLNIHVSALSPPRLRSLPYKELLEKKLEQNIKPRVHEITRLVPEDQYFLQFNSFDAAGEFLDLTVNWGDSLLRLFSPRARDNRVQEKLEDQLCLKREGLRRLFAEGVASELALTGSDPYMAEGTDFTVIFRLQKPEQFEKAAAEWLEDIRSRYPGLEERSFNYRGQQILARYTADRVVSSFVVRHGDHIVYSTSHRAMRRVVDTFTGAAPPLYDALDYRYVTTLMPPSDDPRSGYLFASEAFLKRLVTPAFKIGEKRRLECFNNLVMLNNASLFYRMEHGTSPTSLTDLTEGRYIDPGKLICPHGGAYSWDTRHDSCSCSLHNRLKYLTPNVEISTLKVSAREQQEYERYKQRYQAFWQGFFDPIAVRLTGGPRVRLEVYLLPLANGSLYQEVRDGLAKRPLPIHTLPFAPSAVTSLVAVRTPQDNANWLREIPGVPEALEADPTLTDLSWIGSRVALHLCDADGILEVDPTRLQTLKLLGSNIGLPEQALAALGVTAMKLPLYVTLDVEDRDKASRLLELLAAKIVLKKGDVFGLPTAVDAYRLPDYKGHAVYVLGYRVYALKMRLHVALVGDQLVAATQAKTLREVIDAASAKDKAEAPEAHLLVRLNRQALNQMTGDLQLYWEEKARLACHENIMAITHLVKLYGVPVAEVNRLAEAKYGVRYYCPDGASYRYDQASGEVLCSVHGNRQHSRQTPGVGADSSFGRFLNTLDEVVATLRFEEDGLLATVDIVRSPAKPRNRLSPP